MFYRLLIFLLIIQLTSFCYSENDDGLRQEELEFVGIINSGNNNSEIGYDKYALTKSAAGVRTFTLSDNNEFYICDPYNNKIGVYSIKLSYKRMIKLEGPSYLNRYYADKILVSGSNEIVVMGYKFGLTKYTESGKLVYNIDASKLTRSILYHKHLLLVNGIIYYYLKNELMMIDLQGDIAKIDVRIHQLYVEENFKLNSSFIKYLNENDILLINKTIFPRDYGNLLQIRELNQNSRIISNNENIDIDELNTPVLIGIDMNGNTYWAGNWGQNGRKSVFIFSNTGMLLDAFNYNLKFESLTISNTGEIYFIRPEIDGTYFYRIRNTWDPIDTDTTSLPDTSTATSTTQTAPPRAVSLTATSFIDWKDLYTPAAIFDNNPKTCWLENAPGPGIGQEVKLKLDKPVTVDRIDVMPGFFDPQWWSSNNRVKKLEVTYDGKKMTLTFRDVMENQPAKLPKEITFSEISFKIVEVYPSGKDDDTGISEIVFYKDGEKAEMDFSGVGKKLGS